MVIFYLIFFSLYGLANLYLYLGLGRIFFKAGLAHKVFSAVFGVTALSFFIGRIFSKSSVSEVFTWVGSFWFAFMLYSLLGIGLVDLLRLCCRWVSLFGLTNWERKARVGVVLISIVILGGGYLNALEPRVNTLRLHIPKNIAGLNELKVVAVSDIHLGAMMGRSRFQGIWEKINALDADLILLPGDILDADPSAAYRNNVGDLLRSLKSRYGVFAVTGNHEYIGGVEEACSYLEEHGIVVLRDASIKLDGRLYLVGREDRSKKRFTGFDRKPLRELTKDLPPDVPIILMDHQPFDLDDGASCGVDLQISGHTHHGQLWPLNLITNLVYEVSWGYIKKGSTHVYVSCGAGTWGPPVRIGNEPEIVNIILTFGT